MTFNFFEKLKILRCFFCTCFT